MVAAVSGTEPAVGFVTMTSALVISILAARDVFKDLGPANIPTLNNTKASTTDAIIFFIRFFMDLVYTKMQLSTKRKINKLTFLPETATKCVNKGGTVQRILAFALLLCSVLAVSSWNGQIVRVCASSGSTAYTYGDLTVPFIDVGQADAIVVQFPDGKVMFVDAGLPGATPSTASRQNYLKYLSDFVFADAFSKGEKPYIDWFVVTHSDSDHIAAAPHATYGLFANFTIGTIYRPAIFTTAEVAELNAAPIGQIYGKNFGTQWTSVNTVGFTSFISAAYDGEREVIFHQFAESFSTGEVDIDFYPPQKFYYSNNSVGINSQCPYIVLTYQGKRIMLTGDAHTVNQAEWLARGLELKMDILKVAHHGGEGSNGLDFFKNIKPAYAVISVGPNSYGHPFQYVLDNLEAAGVLPENILRTDQLGHITGTISDKGEIRIVTQFNRHTQSGEPIYLLDYWWVGAGLLAITAVVLFTVTVARRKK